MAGVSRACSEAPTLQIRRRFPPCGAKMGRASNAAKVPNRDPARSENGCSTHGLDDASPETRAATLAMRADWKFFAVHSFCHTFRAVLRLPEFTSEELERSLIDPISHTLIIEVRSAAPHPDPPHPHPLLLSPDPIRPRSPPLDAVPPIDPSAPDRPFALTYPPLLSPPAPSAPPAPQILLRLLEDVPNPGARVFVDDWESRLLRLVEIVAEESDAFEDAYPSNHDVDPPAYGHPLRDGRTLFDLTPHERLDLIHVLCEDALDREEGACASEVAAMARDHAAPTSDAFGGHPEAHGDPVGFDSDGRAYYVCGKDVRVYAWEKPIGKGWKEPGFATVCAHAAECRSLAESLSGKKSGKDKALREYLVEQHLPPHDAEEEKARRAARAEKAREEGGAIRAANKAKYDALDRKRSGRIAMKIAEDAERRRKEEEEAEARAEVEAIVAAREEARQTACWRWMLLPPRLRPAEVPDGMNPETSDAALAAEAAETANAQTASLSGEASVGRYVKIHWDADGAWYDAKVESHDARTGQHTVRYLADDAVETLDLDGERKRWMPESAYATPSGRPIPPAEAELPGLEYRGVRMEGKGATTLCARRPARGGRGRTRRDPSETGRGRRTAVARAPSEASSPRTTPSFRGRARSTRSTCRRRRNRRRRRWRRLRTEPSRRRRRRRTGSSRRRREPPTGLRRRREPPTGPSRGATTER